jgi:hypothetical protein
VNGWAVLAGMAVVYGAFALLDPRLRAKGSGRVLIVLAWVGITVAAVALTAVIAGPAASIAHPGPDDVPKLLTAYVVYGVAMSLLMSAARVAIVTTPLLLVAHGFAVAAVGQDAIAFLFPIAVVLSPLVLYAAMHDCYADFTGLVIRVILYLWCVTIVIAYSAIFIGDELVHGGLLSTSLIAIPLLLVRVCSFGALLVLLPSRDLEDYAGALDTIVGYAQIHRIANVLAVSLSAAAAGAMVVAVPAGQAPLVFVASFGAAQRLGFRLHPPERGPTPFAL